MPRKSRIPGAEGDMTGRGRRVLTGELRGPDLRAAVGRNIRQIRRELGLTLDKMSERTGIASAYLGQMERGAQNITMDSLSNLAAACGVQPHDLICGRKYGVPSTRSMTLEHLAMLTAAIDRRVQGLLLQHGPVPVGVPALASVIGAAFEAIGHHEEYTPTSRLRPT